MPSLRKFSSMAGVSPATVSRIFAHKGPVANKTRDRVLALAKLVGFRPSAVGQVAFGGRTRSVGVLVPVLDVTYFADIATGLQETLLAEDYLPMVLQSSIDEDRRAIRRLPDHKVDALCLSLIDESMAPEDFSEVAKTKVPVVVISPLGTGLMFDMACDDDIGGGLQAGEHLVALGHRRIAFGLFGEGRSSSTLRQQGLVQSLTQHGLKLTKDNIALLPARIPNPRDAFHRDVHRILSQPNRPTAFFASTDLMAAQVYLVARELGLRIPHDLSVVGYADLGFSAHIDPPLTTVRQDGRELGRQAATLILKRLFQPTMPRQDVMVPTQLIVRASTGPAPRP